MPDPDLEIRGALSSRALDKWGRGGGGLQKKIFRSSDLSSVQNKRGGGAVPWIRHCYERAKVVTMFIFDLTLYMSQLICTLSKPEVFSCMT